MRGLLQQSRGGFAGARYADRPGGCLLGDVGGGTAAPLAHEEFELAKTRVSTSLPENDLFAGIKEEEEA